MFGITIKSIKLFQRGAAGALLLVMPLLVAATAQAAEKDNQIADKDITNAVENELITAEQVESYRIDVDTADGIVELSGSVNDLLAKRYAEREAETIKGVRAVVNRIEVRDSGLRDRQITNHVLAALADDPATDTWEIRAEVDDGVVTLEGTVDSYAERDLAEAVTAGAAGVRGIRNKIEVDYNVARGDGEIQRDIQRRLATSAWIDDGLIDVEVEQGRVILSGSVSSAAEKSQVSASAWVAGVTSVDDDALEVKWWLHDDMQRESTYTSLDDEQIEEAVRDAFRYDPRIASFNPTVSVSNGTVTLTGAVDNLKAKRAAERDARNTKGVWRVNNFLRVRGVDLPNDAEIRTSVNAALVKDVYIARHEITTTVFNGHVYLYGTVDSQFEKERAEEVASGIDGVAAVTNYITVDEAYDFASSNDLEIEADIEDQLFWSPYVDADQVNVTVVDGVATLSGAVDSWAEWGAARDNALEGGARRVMNQLEVEGS